MRMKISNSSSSWAVSSFPLVAVIAAAGSGTRLGFAQPKAFVPLEGQTLLERAVRGLLDAGVEHVVVVVSAEMLAPAQELVGDSRVDVCVGGAERADSVLCGLRRLAERYDPSSTVVLVHDAARCLTPGEVVTRVAEAVRPGVGVIPVMPVVDTVKTVDAGGRIQSTPPRESLRAAQTPQGFVLGDLLAANERLTQSPGQAQPGDAGSAEVAGFEPTDDASIVEFAGGEVQTVAGHVDAMKITTPVDYRIAQLLLRGELANIEPPDTNGEKITVKDK